MWAKAYVEGFGLLGIEPKLSLFFEGGREL